MNVMKFMSVYPIHVKCNNRIYAVNVLRINIHIYEWTTTYITSSVVWSVLRGCNDKEMYTYHLLLYLFPSGRFALLNICWGSRTQSYMLFMGPVGRQLISYTGSPTLSAFKTLHCYYYVCTKIYIMYMWWINWK